MTVWLELDDCEAVTLAVCDCVCDMDAETDAVGDGDGESVCERLREGVTLAVDDWLAVSLAVCVGVIAATANTPPVMAPLTPGEPTMYTGVPTVESATDAPNASPVALLAIDEPSRLATDAPLKLATVTHDKPLLTKRFTAPLPMTGAVSAGEPTSRLEPSAASATEAPKRPYVLGAGARRAAVCAQDTAVHANTYTTPAAKLFV